MRCCIANNCQQQNGYDVHTASPVETPLGPRVIHTCTHADTASTQQSSSEAGVNPLFDTNTARKHQSVYCEGCGTFKLPRRSLASMPSDPNLVARSASVTCGEVQTRHMRQPTHTPHRHSYTHRWGKTRNQHSARWLCSDTTSCEHTTGCQYQMQANDSTHGSAQQRTLPASRSLSTSSATPTTPTKPRRTSPHRVPRVSCAWCLETPHGRAVLWAPQLGGNAQRLKHFKIPCCSPHPSLQAGNCGRRRQRGSNKQAQTTGHPTSQSENSNINRTTLHACTFGRHGGSASSAWAPVHTSD